MFVENADLPTPNDSVQPEPDPMTCYCSKVGGASVRPANRMISRRL